MFLDRSVRKIGCNELWTLKWHRKSNTAGNYTSAGGIAHDERPHWMRSLKDY